MPRQQDQLRQDGTACHRAQKADARCTRRLDGGNRDRIHLRSPRTRQPLAKRRRACAPSLSSGEGLRPYIASRHQVTWWPHVAGLRPTPTLRPSSVALSVRAVCPITFGVSPSGPRDSSRVRVQRYNGRVHGRWTRHCKGSIKGFSSLKPNNGASAISHHEPQPISIHFYLNEYSIYIGSPLSSDTVFMSSRHIFVEISISYTLLFLSIERSEESKAAALPGALPQTPRKRNYELEGKQSW